MTSESKAKLIKLLDSHAAQLDKQTDDIVFLLRALLDIKAKHPEVELPDLHDGRFSRRIWWRLEE